MKVKQKTTRQANNDCKGRKQVPLRIDSRTVIYVTPGKATEEYAEQWRRKHEADQRHSCAHEFADQNSKLNQPRRRGGRQ